MTSWRSRPSRVYYTLYNSGRRPVATPRKTHAVGGAKRLLAWSSTWCFVLNRIIILLFYIYFRLVTHGFQVYKIPGNNDDNDIAATPNIVHIIRNWDYTRIPAAFIIYCAITANRHISTTAFSIATNNNKYMRT